MLEVYGSKHSLFPSTCEVEAVGMGASNSELRTPCFITSARRASQSQRLEGFTFSAGVAVYPAHGQTVAEGTEHIRGTVVTFVRNSAIGTLILAAVAGWLLFPSRRPKAPKRDWAIAAVLAVLVATSLYQLFWLRSVL